MSPISIRTTRLAVSLLWLAGGNYWDICGLYGVAPGSFYSERGPLWPTLYALNEALHKEIVFDVNVEACQKAADSLSVFSRGRMNHCACAVDDKLFESLISSKTTYINLISKMTTHSPVP